MAFRPRIAFLAIFALFLLPLALAWLMHTGALRFEPERTDNLGRLVIPPVPLDWNLARLDLPDRAPDGLEGAWVMLFPLAEPCDVSCLQRVRTLRQVWRAMGRRGERVRLAVLSRAPAGSPGLALREIHPQLYLLQHPGAGFEDALRRAADGARQPSVYLVDPQGNIMMTYAPEDDLNMLRKDLQKLLARSPQAGQR